MPRKSSRKNKKKRRRLKRSSRRLKSRKLKSRKLRKSKFRYNGWHIVGGVLVAGALGSGAIWYRNQRKKQRILKDAFKAYFPDEYNKYASKKELISDINYAIWLATHIEKLPDGTTADPLTLKRFGLKGEMLREYIKNSGKKNDFYF